MAREDDIFAGAPSRKHVAAAIQLARPLGPWHTVATVAVAFGLRYLAGGLYEA